MLFAACLILSATGCMAVPFAENTSATTMKISYQDITTEVESIIGSQNREAEIPVEFNSSESVLTVEQSVLSEMMNEQENTIPEIVTENPQPNIDVNLLNEEFVTRINQIHEDFIRKLGLGSGLDLNTYIESLMRVHLEYKKANHMTTTEPDFYSYN